jgi:hypothetical protein
MNTTTVVPEEAGIAYGSARGRMRICRTAEEFLVLWDHFARPGIHTLAYGAAFLEHATDEQLGVLTHDDLLPYLASGDPWIRTAAIRAVGRVGLRSA